MKPRNEIADMALIYKQLHVSGLNKPIKRQRLVDRIRKHDSTVCGLQETHFKYNNIGSLKVKGWKNT